MATADEEAMEGRRGGPEVEVADSPVGTISVGGEGHRCGTRVSAHHKSGVRQHRESAPRGYGEEESGEEGGPGPP